MSDNAQPATATAEEREQAAADWTAYAAVHGANGAPAVLRAERRAFAAGWLAHRHHGQAGAGQ